MTDLDGETEPQKETARAGKFQFGLPFLFFLITMTAVVLGVSRTDCWPLAPLIVVIGALFWRTRRAKFAFIPGFGIGVAVGIMIAVFCFSKIGLAPALVLAVYFGAYFGGLGASLNIVIQGEYKESGSVGVLVLFIYAAFCLSPEIR